MNYLRHYYVTLCGKYFRRYVDLYSTDKNRALDRVIDEYGVLNVSKVYTEKAWQNKFTCIFTYDGHIVSEEERLSVRNGYRVRR